MMSFAFGSSWALPHPTKFVHRQNGQVLNRSLISPADNLPLHANPFHSQPHSEPRKSLQTLLHAGQRLALRFALKILEFATERLHRLARLLNVTFAGCCNHLFRSCVHYLLPPGVAPGREIFTVLSLLRFRYVIGNTRLVLRHKLIAFENADLFWVAGRG